MSEINRIFLEHPFFGSRQMRDEIGKKGVDQFVWDIFGVDHYLSSDKRGSMIGRYTKFLTPSIMIFMCEDEKSTTFVYS